ncbi:MAG TPA: hypothetical protein VGD87_08340, partial [Archangium sp.]
REKWPLTLRSLELHGVMPGQAVESLVELPHPLRWLSLVFDVWEPTRWLRDQLPRVRELEGLERLRLTAQDEEVFPALLGEMGLEWLPARIGVLELRDGDRLIVLRRDGPSWSAEFIDLEQPWPRPSRWKSFLSGLTWLKPTSVKWRVSANPDSDDPLEIARRLERFGVPVQTEELEDVPVEFAW